MKKTCATFLSLCLAIFAALTPAAQAAQFSAESSPIRAIALPSASLTPSLPSLNGLNPSSISGSIQAPTTLVPTGAEALEAMGQASLAHLPSISASAAPAASAPASAAASAQAALQQAGRALSADASKSSPEGTLNPLFENTGKQDGDSPVLTPESGSQPSALQPASVRPETADKPGSGVPQGPKSSFKRSAKVGFIGAVTMLTVNIVVAGLAQLVGYHFHPGYHDPTPQHMTLLMGGVFLTVLSVFAPVAEEVMFRWGLMGAVRKLTFNKSKFIVPAVVSSIIFTAVHEMQDPVIFGIRFIGAMILARVYHKEGIAASMSTHGIYNGLPFLPVIASLAFGPGIGSLFGIALVPAALFLAFKFHKELKADVPAREAGKIVPFQITRTMALGLAFFLMLGFLYVIHTPVWVAGLIAWLIYAARHKTAKN